MKGRFSTGGKAIDPRQTPKRVKSRRSRQTQAHSFFMRKEKDEERPLSRESHDQQSEGFGGNIPRHSEGFHGAACSLASPVPSPALATIDISTKLHDIPE